MMGKNDIFVTVPMRLVYRFRTCDPVVFYLFQYVQYYDTENLREEV